MKKKARRHNTPLRIVTLPLFIVYVAICVPLCFVVPTDKLIYPTVVRNAFGIGPPRRTVQDVVDELYFAK